jgi:hypothetical protein
LTIQDLIAKAAPALADLEAQLAAIVKKYPDSGSVLQPKIDALRAAGSAESLFELGKQVMAELAALPSTGLDPKGHPSDLVG